MDLDARATVHAEPDLVLDALADLSTYPHWLGIVASAVPEREGEPAPAWTIELAGRIGPFRRTKRVRMVRTSHDVDAGVVRFERDERDGRSHNRWVLTGEATGSPAGTTDVHVHLHYSGGVSLPGADLLLRGEVRGAGARLEAFLLGGGH